MYVSFYYLFLVVLGSLLLCVNFLQLQQAEATLQLLCSGSSDFRAQALGMLASVLAAWGLRICSSRALEHRLSSFGNQAQLHLESSQTKDQSCIFCVSRLLIHCTTGEVQLLFIYTYIVHEILNKILMVFSYLNFKNLYVILQLLPLSTYCSMKKQKGHKHNKHPWLL